jgi:2-oxoisovalerate dehydrogenase E1 component
VAFIQFAGFLPLGFNQLANELGSLAWRTKCGWQAPVIILVSCGGYRPGLGPFHAGSFESAIAHIPGLDVALPSTAADAAGILNAGFHSERPTIIFYPKALLNDPARSTSAKVADHFTPIGTARKIGDGGDVTLVGWGNTAPLCEKVGETLASVGITADVIDLRWLPPWDREMVCASARRSRRLLVAHEDNITAGFGAEVIATVAEFVDGPVECRRVARPDTYVPCHFGNQLVVLPSYRSILTAAAAMCGLDLVWRDPPQPHNGRLVVKTIGSSPADQSVELVGLPVKLGDHVKAGQTIAGP